MFPKRKLYSWQNINILYMKDTRRTCFSCQETLQAETIWRKRQVCLESGQTSNRFYYGRSRTLQSPFLLQNPSSGPASGCLAPGGAPVCRTARSALCRPNGAVMAACAAVSPAPPRDGVEALAYQAVAGAEPFSEGADRTEPAAPAANKAARPGHTARRPARVLTSGGRRGQSDACRFPGSFF